jgi:hypothetical protein
MNETRMTKADILLLNKELRNDIEVLNEQLKITAHHLDYANNRMSKEIDETAKLRLKLKFVKQDFNTALELIAKIQNA